MHRARTVSVSIAPHKGASMKSMTAFGRASTAGEGYEVTVELRSVNNRYLDWNFRLPRALSSLRSEPRRTFSPAGSAAAR